MFSGVTPSEFFPFKKATRVKLASIAKLRVEKRRWGEVNGKPKYEFFVVATTKRGKDVDVTYALPTKEAGAFLIERFKRHSKAKDRVAVDVEQLEPEVVEEEQEELLEQTR